MIKTRRISHCNKTQMIIILATYFQLCLLNSQNNEARVSYISCQSLVSPSAHSYSQQKHFQIVHCGDVEIRSSSMARDLCQNFAPFPSGDLVSYDIAAHSINLHNLFPHFQCRYLGCGIYLNNSGS